MNRGRNLTALACVAFFVTACVSETKRTGGSDADADTGDGDGPCLDRCAELYPSPPACFTPVWSEDACNCTLVAAEEGSPCDDGNACTLEDRCDDSTCSGQLVDLRTWCDDGDDCTVDNCDQLQGCVHDPTETADVCDDGNHCTFDSRCNELGECRSTNQYICRLCDPTDPDACAEENLLQDACNGRLACIGGTCEVDRATVPRCDDPRLDPCLVPGCDEGACITEPLPDDTPCSDLSACTKGDVCQDGVCTGTPVEVAACACSVPEDCAAFEDGDLCNGRMTCERGVCVLDFASIVVCDDSGDTACLVTRCVPESGECVSARADDESPCDDGDPCTLGDVCGAGTCTGTARDCSELDGRCLVGVCDRFLGCIAAAAENGTRCDPAEPCVSDGTCDASGDCIPSQIGCSDDDACTTDFCDEDLGTCQHLGPEPPECLAEGVCAGGVSLRCELGEYHCDYASVAGWSAVEKCDGRDDDCDGATDDACIAGEACSEGELLAAWSGRMQACVHPTTAGDATCGSGWHACSYSAMVDALAGEAPPAGFYIAASIAFTPGGGYAVVDRAAGCFEFSGVCTNAREVQAMSWDGVFGATVAYAAEAWGCDSGVPSATCETATFAGVMCCSDECDADSDCADASPCTADACVSGRCAHSASDKPVCAAVGVCTGVTPTCGDDGQFRCDYATLSAWESEEVACDGLDNDCDGRIDAADPGFQPNLGPCENQRGVCAGAMKENNDCELGRWSACTVTDYSAYSPFFQADEALCDGRDNDCDGRTDGVFTWQGLVIGAPCDGVGACGAGVVECTSLRTGATCSTNPDGSASGAGRELCNGADDDCDGQTDELEDLDPADAECPSHGVCEGLPRARCTASGWVCDALVVDGFGDETCDGLDNDCDGATDEGFVAAGDALGSACGPVGCPNGVVICNATGGAAVCSSDVDPDLELCDQVDNDCDGQTDEGLSYSDPKQGQRFRAQSCSGRGACGAGVVECGARLALTCSTLGDGSASQAEVETCNGVDDDCDGQTDEGFRWSGLALGLGCDGVGQCGAGTVVCASGGAAATCSTNADGTASQATAERCNGLDDDCDGQADEGVSVGPSDCPSVGACRPEALQATCEGADGWRCDFSASPYFQAGDEIGRCDGRDNDCDGATDEDFPDLGAACDGDDTDTCARGVSVCDPDDPAATLCIGDVIQPETCNGLDDDCDGLTDEPGAGGCALFYKDTDDDDFGTADVACRCAPGDAFTALIPGDCDDTRAAVNPAAPEKCDGVDDDCDGKTDAADAADLVVDDVVSCELASGVCQGTNKPASRCVAGGWQPCQSADYLAKSAAYQTPKETRCDGLDNDCDGAADAADDDISSVPPVCELQQGVCLGAKKPLSLCTAQGWGACTAATYLAHAALYQSGAEATCDAKDNDCDGLVDDDFLWSGKKVGQSCDGTGACGLGSVECAVSGDAATCSTNPDGSQRQDLEETCNAIDDDCDGAADDGLGLSQSPCRKVGVCLPELVVATCSQGAWSCNYSAIDDYESGTELTCDDLDNDCDGPTDEDMSLVIGGQTRRKGDACGSGACSGVYVCNAATGTPGDLICSSEVNGGSEVCDALDNDCDGQTDEGLSWTPSGGQPIALGMQCEGYGECGTGVVECTGNSGTACSTNPDGSESEAATESCNGLDDDCDRTPDDGFKWQGIAVGQACDGTGACGVGIVECRGSGTFATCSTNPDGSEPEGSDEVCNGVDDDCDGQTDEGLGVDDSDCALTGVCTVNNVVATCVGVGGWACDYSAVSWYHEGDEVGWCDELDNDCDGATDEDYPEIGAACDLPDDPDKCFYGEWSCARVLVADPAVPMGTTTGDTTGTGEPYCEGDEPSPETCSSGDQDCDGLVDEEGAVGCKVYFKDADGDSYGKAGDFKCLCTAGAVPFYTAQGTTFDCDDSHADVHPGAEELCNHVDDNCDSKTDPDGTKGCADYYFDRDDDGFGVDNNVRCLCWEEQGFGTGHTAPIAGDCCDGDARAKPEQSSFFPTPNECGSYDFDCDDEVELQIAVYGGCVCTAETCATVAQCRHEYGWGRTIPNGGTATIPDCGQSAPFVTSCDFLQLLCLAHIETFTQRCH